MLFFTVWYVLCYVVVIGSFCCRVMVWTAWSRQRRRRKWNRWTASTSTEWRPAGDTYCFWHVTTRTKITQSLTTCPTMSHSCPVTVRYQWAALYHHGSCLCLSDCVICLCPPSCTCRRAKCGFWNLVICFVISLDDGAVCSGQYLVPLNDT